MTKITNININKFKLVPKSDSFEEKDEVNQAELVLQAAAGELSEVLLIGQTLDDQLYIAATTGDKRELLYWIEDFKMRLMSGEYDQ